MKKQLFIFVAILFFSNNLFGQNERLQATYIYNIVKHIDWPKEYKSGDFVIGVLGSGSIVDELKKIANTKKVYSQKITIVEFAKTDDITNCHALFITKINSNSISGVISRIGRNATLIIGESPKLSSFGAAINFIKVDGKLVFEINESAANKQGLKVSSSLKELSIY